MSKWTMHHGDSLLWPPTLPAESATMLLTDPPYSSGGLHATSRKAGSVDKYVRTETQAKREFPEFHGDNRDQRSLLAWMTLWLAECHRILVPGGVAVVFTDWRQLPLATDAYQASGFTWRGILAWDKTDAARTSAPGYPRHQCEYALWGSKGPLPKRPPETGLTIPGALRYPIDREREHPTGKPLGLLLDLLKIGKPGGVVLDPFAGSGTTGAAALRSGCSFLGCEMSAEYHAPHHVVRVDGKSSPGRLSLEVHRTAGHIEPAFAGQITLEMAVLAPLRIPVGWPICQVRFCEVTGEVEAYTTRGSYADAGAFDGPQTSRSYLHKLRHVRQTP